MFGAAPSAPTSFGPAAGDGGFSGATSAPPGAGLFGAGSGVFGGGAAAGGSGLGVGNAGGARSGGGLFGTPNDGGGGLFGAPKGGGGGLFGVPNNGGGGLFGAGNTANTFGGYGSSWFGSERLVKVRITYDNRHKTVMVHASTTIGAVLKDFCPSGKAEEDLEMVTMGDSVVISRDVKVGLIDAGPVAPPVELCIQQRQIW
eukprot:TRINITY_DN89552_c0_g1_i1.p1 TRINITY_DN89552_c0_g1~~TRINITY_DN89552_c0_g1_i1.p1  ORF type:complete len:201 (-),score=25.74 TRINITY_DN89552_c0_g1_i1:241-843(-)